MFVIDEFFVLKDCMFNFELVVFILGKYDDYGKWMDGWEMCCCCNGGYDYCIVCLVCFGVVKGVDIDMSYFIGNFLLVVFIEVVYLLDGELIEVMQWIEIVLLIML